MRADGLCRSARLPSPYGRAQVHRGTAGEHSPFPEIDHEIGLQPILDELAPRDRVPDEETEPKDPEIIGGPGLALAQAFKIVHPDLKNPQSHHWDQIRAIFDLLL
ncbi:DUF1931 family protein [Streptomyces sp. NPDC001820]|uniref:DUF1931 family protein n=1 Tax=Streptomyces sp. NPDC001820 TaxID=3364613 RepID=UPI00368D006E